MKFSALNVDFNSPSPDPLGSIRPVHTGFNKKFELMLMRCVKAYSSTGSVV